MGIFVHILSGSDDMANSLKTIKLKRGLKTNLPTLDIGEPGFVTDEGELYIGTNSGNVKVTSKSELADITQDVKKVKSNVEYKSVAHHVSDWGYSPTESELTHIFNQGVSIELINMVKILNLTDSSPIGMSLTNLQNEINRIKNKGIEISILKPHLGVNGSDSTNRATFNPSDKPLFFTNWKNLLLDYASICNTNSIPILCLTCEMSILTTSTYLSYWQDIYSSIKALYPNLLLTHAPTTGEFYSSSNYSTWEYSDILGTNFYPSYGSKEFTDNARISDTDLQNVITRMAFEMTKQRFVRNLYPDKPFFFTEIGVMPYTDSLIECISYSYTQGTGVLNYWVQEALGRAIFQYLCKDPDIIGFCWWSVREPFQYFNDTETLPLEQLFIDYVKGGLI